jgi:hypothetical protein
MSIITNRVRLIFHLDVLKNDFVFLSFKQGENGKWWGAKELDYLIGDDYQALAVCYTREYAYAMFNRNQNNGYELIQKLRNDKDFENVIARECQPHDINQQDDLISAESLGRLLLNYLGSSRSKFSDQHFSNLTGALLKVPSLAKNNFADSLQVAEINLKQIKNNEFLLNVSMATYRLKINILSEYKTVKSTERKKQLEKYLKRPEYVVYGGKNVLRRWLKTDDSDPKKTYIKAGKYRKKAHQDFLKFTNLKDFAMSRAGVFHQVVNDLKKYLLKYLTLEFITLPVEKALEFDNNHLILKTPKNLHNILKNQAINIIDLVDNKDSQQLVHDLEDSLIPYFQNKSLISISNHEIQGVFNLRIIHDEQFYQKNNLEDQYLASDEVTQRQNITIESVTTTESAIIKTLIKELIIKQDISRKKISLFTWEKIFNSSKMDSQLSLFNWNNEKEGHSKTNSKWIFAMFKEKSDQDSETLTFMTIYGDGSFVFENLNPDDIFFEEDKYQEYYDYIENAISIEKTTKSSFKFEGFIISENGDINLIFRSDEITLPKLQEIESLLKEIEIDLPENLRNGSILTEIVEDFLEKNVNLDLKKFNNLCQELRNNYSYNLSKKELYNLIQEYLGSKGKANTKEATQFRDYLLKKYQVRFKFPQDIESKDDLFDNSLNIKYFGETETEAYYFVGNRLAQIQTSFKDACHIRKIIAIEGSKLIFKDLLKTMDVDFVRTRQSTVIPFPFKYIREYHQIMN